MNTKLYGGHEAEMEYLSANTMSIPDMCNALIKQAEETLRQDSPFAAMFGEKTPEDYADYMDKLAEVATAFAAKIKAGDYAK